MSYPREEIKEHIRKCNWVLYKKLVETGEDDSCTYLNRVIYGAYRDDPMLPDVGSEKDYYAAYKECQDELFNMVPNDNWRDLIVLDDIIQIVSKLHPRFTVKEYENTPWEDYDKISRRNEHYKKLIAFLIEKY